MKAIIKASRARYEKFMPVNAFTEECEKIYFPLSATNEEILSAAADADVFLADAIASVDRELIEGMPNLKLIHSEGVAYNLIDTVAAKEKGIPVCNNKGANAGAVAEQAILLMLSLLRNFSEGRAEELAGHQIKMKERKMLEGIRELSECKVGLVGFGDIAKATAERLKVFGCEVYYYNHNRRPEEIEQQYNVTYLPMEELIATCDIVSLHLAVTPDTENIVDAAFLGKMKKDAFLINTSRGELVDNQALREALINGSIGGAGLDTIAPEPTTADNLLVDLPEEALKRVEYSPHLGGITTGTFKRCHKNIWANAERVMKGENPINVVNGVVK